ncbi:hypothetical protein LR48_Vigan11g119800 [Vigna angularis]|uniref:Putative plant transposon protein domain-containing protein n=1 Tax=Phaseolus angularis TaxID=3914 RepID=A0A0L9VTR5_PHAAN|nr:hypothetical protein LR48_Vigan11g119800 [Vigna angularis]
MASASGSKRIKTTAAPTKKGRAGKNKMSQPTFLSEEHQQNFETSQNKRLLMERVVEEIHPEAPQFGAEVERRHWSILTTFPAPANIAIVWEFYANARIYSDEAEPFMSYVRGRQVPFNADAINSFLSIQWPGGNTQCQYSQASNNDFEGVDFQEVERTLCLPRGHFHRNRQGQPLHIKRSFLHLSANTGAVLLYFILQGQAVNVGQDIATEINDCANTPLNNTPLGHPSLITHLCALAGVDTSNPPFERPRKTIDRSYFLQYCSIDEEGQHIPPPQPPRPHRRNRLDPHAQPEQVGPQNPFQMAEINDKLEAIYRMGLAHIDMMRHVYASSHPSFMTPEEYAARVAWPGDQTQHSGGGGTSSGAQAMEEDQSEEEEDEEEEATEEDTESNS